MFKISSCPICGAEHKSKFPDNESATALASDGPGLTWESFDEANADTKAYQVACQMCDFDGPHADNRAEAVTRWNANAAQIRESNNDARLAELDELKQTIQQIKGMLA